MELQSVLVVLIKVNIHMDQETSVGFRLESRLFSSLL